MAFEPVIFGGHRLRLETRNSATLGTPPLAMGIQAIFLPLAGGRPQEIEETFTLTTVDRTREDFETQEATKDSRIVSLVVGHIGDAPRRGQTYVTVREWPRGTTLLGGYVYAGFQECTLGNMIPPGPSGGQGDMITNFDAASSQTSTFTVPANARWKLHGAWAENRTQASTKVAVSLQDGSNNVYYREMIDSEADGSDDLNATGGGRLKGMMLLEGHDLLVKVVTFTASDDTEKGALVEEWIEV